MLSEHWEVDGFQVLVEVWLWSAYGGFDFPDQSRNGSACVLIFVTTGAISRLIWDFSSDFCFLFLSVGSSITLVLWVLGLPSVFFFELKIFFFLCICRCWVGSLLLEVRVSPFLREY